MENIDINPSVSDNQPDIYAHDYADGYYVCKSGVFTYLPDFSVSDSFEKPKSWLDGDEPPKFTVSNQLTFVGMLQNALMKFAKWIFLVVALLTVLAVIGHVVS